MPLRGIKGLVTKGKREEEELEKGKKEKPFIKDYPLFKKIKPRKNLRFYSDYFTIDNSYATVLTVLHHQGSDDSLGYFWGINLIPRNLGKNVSVRKLEHVGRMSESWISTHQDRAEGLLKNQAGETNREGSLKSRQKLSKREQQLMDISRDLMNGASYLKVSFRLLVKADSLKDLDDAVEKINRQYKDRFDTVHAEAYIGEQRRELSNLFNKIGNKTGKGFMFTSSEFAGNYSLVTRGIEDKDGEYIGQMEGDVNNSAVLMNLDKYSSHLVLAGKAKAQTLSGFNFKGLYGSDVWGIKIGTNALLRNKRVVHLVLNKTKVDKIGVDLSDITSVVDMNRGDINPFELFGEKKDELNIFPAHLEKLYLMVEQLQPMTDERRARIKGALKEVLNEFYVDKKMWARNAKKNRKALRVVGIPHKEVPRLPHFQAYLNMEYKSQVSARSKDEEVQNAYGFLRTVFRDMMDSNGDLFDTYTSDIIDRAKVSSRVIYDFSSLIQRGRGVMMAQFVNALSYAVGSLNEGDVVVLHGAEHLDSGVKQHVADKFDHLQDNGVRIVYTYNSIEKMIKDKSFNQFESADYTLLGGMTRSTIDNYEQSLKQEVPVVLKALLEHKEPHRWYLRRGFDNVIFANDLQMGFEE